jgi:hypothetical protein
MELPQRIGHLRDSLPLGPSRLVRHYKLHIDKEISYGLLVAGHGNDLPPSRLRLMVHNVLW